MKDLTTKNKVEIQESTISFSEQLSSLLSSKEIDWSGMQPAIKPKNIPIIAKTDAIYHELKQKESQLLAALKSTSANELITLLSKLRLHYPLSNIEANQVKVFLSDYLEDLSIYPTDIIALACKEYRQNPNNKFFPKIGELLKPIRDKWFARKWQLIQVKILLARANSNSAISNEEMRQMIRQVHAEIDESIKQIWRKI